MSSKEISQSAILLLKAKALESYGIIKDRLQQSPTEGTADDIATQAMRLVQFEGAALTLQGYFAGGVSETEAQEQPAEEAVSAPPPAEKEDVIVVTEEMSPSYKRSVQKEKIRRTAKKMAKKKEK